MSAALTTAFALPANAEDVVMRDLPEPVRVTIERETKGGVIEDIERETRADGVVYYEVEFEKADKDWQLKIDADGKVLARQRDD